MESTEGAQANAVEVGCAGWPKGLHKDKYFDKLDYLEATETFSAPPGDKVLSQWAVLGGHFGLVADQRISHSVRDGRYQTAGDDASQWGDYRDTPAVRAAVVDTVSRAKLLQAKAVVFRTAPSFSPSAGNRDRLRHFFSDIVANQFGDAWLVWEPAGLWQPQSAVTLAEELGLVIAVDAFAEDPQGGMRPRPVDLVPRERGYLRQRAIGRTAGFRGHEIDELAELVGEFEACRVVFGNADKNRDAKALKRLLAE